MLQFGIKGESVMVGIVLPRDLMVLRVQQRDNYPLRNVGMRRMVADAATDTRRHCH